MVDVCNCPLSSIVGFSRMGPHRELKKRVERFWKNAGPLDGAQSVKEIQSLEHDLNKLQIQRWHDLKEQGLDIIPSGDYSLYDQILDTSFMFNVIPLRYRALESKPTVRTYFSMSRGHQENSNSRQVNVSALPMKKWFDTNYHFIVPEFELDQKFELLQNKPLADFLLAKNELGLITKPVIIGPITYLHLGHFSTATERNTIELLAALLPCYKELVSSLVVAGAEWIQFDEPILVQEFDLSRRQVYHKAFETAYNELNGLAKSCKILISTYFGSIIKSQNGPVISSLPKGIGLHIDLVRAPEQLDMVVSLLPDDSVLSLGVVDGRNIWTTDLNLSCRLVKSVIEKLGVSRTIVGTSCSLLHVPYSIEGELGLSSSIGDLNREKIFRWMAFGLEKAKHVVMIAQASSGRIDSWLSSKLEENTNIVAERETSPLLVDPKVRERVNEVKTRGFHTYFRQEPYSERILAQQERLGLPLIPTTTIGSYPQSELVRTTRAQFRTGKITYDQYMDFIKKQTAECVKIQEDIGLDVLVHGEFERTDMVEFFAEYLKGFFVTENGWVQSYGTRCVRPPVIYGDISRPLPMTVDMIKYAQSLTDRPVKGMLTGPTTMLQWSFLRNDIPHSDIHLQMSLALRDEVSDLEKAGIPIIQVDEPAFREALPLDESLRTAFLRTAIDDFKVTTGVVSIRTQIHTHMCYSDFAGMLSEVAMLDADVLSIECARSDLCLLKAFAEIGYPLHVGPGLYDIHSPNVPSCDELKNLLRAIANIIPVNRLFANPDCGLKTRAWPETKAALNSMVQAVKCIREEYSKSVGQN